ncbi:uncharacterized protein LOC125489178 [Plutella xylostella]|uniref:uncharacterized protein LOC125489178 n=1 Tax=Plutella xylostella TaxID=51655 RepID=UPI0020330E50|nr:uncharacterized protein LOC125489178 [Plutella xylostella]
MKRPRRGKKPKAAPDFVTISDVQDAETTCSVCEAEFLDSEDLRVHVAQVHPYTAAEGLTCHLCSSTAPDQEAYLQHVCFEHFPSLKCCRYCLRGFIDSEELRKHEESHVCAVDNMLSCSQCRVMFSKPKDLEDHEVANHSDVKDGVMLQKHYKLLSSILNIRSDIFLKSLCSNSTFMCAQCRFTTSDVSVYVKHLQKKKCTSLVCDHCAGVYRRKAHMRKHFKHSRKCSHGYKPENSKLKCRECMQFFDKRTYKFHVKKCRALRCVPCNITFTTVNELTSHQTEKHPVAMVLRKCRYCHLELVGAKALRQHMERCHRKDYHLYKYKCPHCVYIFKHPKQMLGHFFSRHKDIKPYSCKICNIEWRIRKTFTIHIKMAHNSVGFVEFDKNFNVFFTEKKLENAFTPPDNPSLYNEAEEQEIRNFTNDYETDEEKKNTKSGNKKRKVNTSKEESSTNLETDTMAPTDNETDAENVKRKVLTRKKKSLTKELLTDVDPDMSSDDEPLIDKKNRAKKSIGPKKWHSKKHKVPLRLTCSICKKYCYTVENYHRHVSTHFKNESKQCIKCAKLFTSVDELDNHLKTDHATTHITDTLKRLMEKRKMVTSFNNIEPLSDRIRRTVKKVYVPQSNTTATLKLTSNTAKNFLESFIPETDVRKNVSINDTLCIKPVKGKLEKQTNVIKLTKFKPEPKITGPVKLRMPVQFNRFFKKTEPVSATIKVFQGDYKEPKLNFDRKPAIPEDEDIPNDDYYDDYNQEEEKYDANSTQNSTIPEVAQEVFLENTEDIPKHITVTDNANQGVVSHSIVLPASLPTDGLLNNIQVGHLHPKAPFFKIVPFEEILNPKKEPSPGPEEAKEDDDAEVLLPSGTKLVNINPLAHLLGDKTEMLLKSFEEKRKYYKYKPKLNLKTALHSALTRLEAQQPKPRKKQAPKKKKAVKDDVATDAAAASAGDDDKPLLTPTPAKKRRVSKKTVKPSS